MNTNEVVAHRATEILGAKVHPNDHVNFAQSSNDVIPTAIHVSARVAIERELVPALEHLHKALMAKAVAFDDIVKSGRTHLMDATPVRLGQEFKGYATQIRKGLERVRRASEELEELALGGTATGTGINTDPEFPGRAIAKIAELTGIAFREADDHFEAQGAKDAAVSASGALNTVATSFLKIADDIRWLGSGPTSGIHEIKLPAIQPGSSIMPGKVNPVIAESVIQACAQVQGNDLVVALGNQWGTFELNTMMPVTAHNLLWSISLLAAESANFATQCIAGLSATPRAAELVERGLMLTTALAPVIGYDKAAEIAKKAAATGRTIREVAREETTLSEAELKEILNAERMTEPGFHGGGGG
jgi:fumarate hydratase class II